LGDPPQDTWLRIRGTVQTGSATAATGYVPAMTVTAAEVVAAPPDPYEY
ncbi:MAG: TIGR03943 family protein, partial [Pseudonocardia sp.]|nr:TIGR03943 family protein [Pseudonocardia sp.]